VNDDIILYLENVMKFYEIKEINSYLMKNIIFKNYKKYLVDFIFYFFIVFFIVALNFRDNSTAGWYQQFMPTPLGGSIKDICFVDSLLGFAVSDSTILKTTNGGDNWSVKYSNSVNFERIQFINSNTGFVCRYINQLYKTTNSGENWFTISLPSNLFPENMSVLNNDTIWLVLSDLLVGGVFRTTNGGTSWQVQFSQGSNNPSHIYMYNGKIGFMDGGTTGFSRTTNSGVNWIGITGEGAFTKMFFIDSLTGWKCDGVSTMKKTTNGGINWFTLPLPSGGYIFSDIHDFTLLNKDTIWGTGGDIWYAGGNNESRAILYRTTNGGVNWHYQLPDTSFGVYKFFHIQFTNKNIGWAYYSNGIHTKTGGDSSFVMSANENIKTVPANFKLEQNYPNPFNSKTKIKIAIKFPLNKGGQGGVLTELKVYDITGKEVQTIVNKVLQPGEYIVTFNGINLNSGVYFYKLTVGNYSETKKLILLK